MVAFDNKNLPTFDLDDLLMNSLDDPVSARQFLAVVNKLARGIYGVAYTRTYVRAAVIQSVDAGPPLSLTVKFTNGDQTLVPGVRYQQGLVPVVGDVVFVMSEAGFNYVTGKVA